MSNRLAYQANVNNRYRSNIEGVVRPRSVVELQAVVQKQKGMLKVLGGGYSVGSLAIPDEGALIVDVSRFDHVGPIVDGTVTVGAGLTIRKLLDRLRTTGWQPGVIPLFGNFKVGGVASTSFYDSAVFNGHDAHFSSDVLSYELVMADGSVRSVGGDSPEDVELRYFLRTAQGLLGIITEVTLRVYPAVMLRVNWASRSIDDILALQPPSPGKRGEYFYINPRTGKGVVETHENIGPAQSNRGRRSGCIPRLTSFIARFLDTLVNKCVPARFASTLQAFITTLLVCIYHLIGPFLLSPYDKGTLGPSKRPISLSDWQFPRADFVKVYPELLALCKRFLKEAGTCPAFISLYWVPQSDAAAGYHTDGSNEALVSVDVVHYHSNSNALASFEIAWAELARKHNGAVSINKNADANVTSADVQKVFGEHDFHRFRELCVKLDPSGRFRNSMLRTSFDLPESGELANA